MIATRKNEDGFVYAYAEYRIVRQDTTPDESGEFCFCKELWVHPKYERKGVIQDIIKSEHKKYPKVKWLYWRRTKYGGRMKQFPIERLYA